MLQQARHHVIATGMIAATMLLCIGFAAGETEAAPPAQPAQPHSTSPDLEAAAGRDEARASAAEPVEYISIAKHELAGLMEEVDELIQNMVDLRRRAAEAELAAAQAQRELAELRQFLNDHEELGEAYAEYTHIKAVAEREARQREIERLRAEHAQRLAERRRSSQLARQERDLEREFTAQLAEYEHSGFSHIGLGVFTGKMAYYYRTTDNTARRVDYHSDLGHYLRLYPGTSIDFSNMTISGSVLNAENDTRDIGVAIVFFDERGNQVGQETVQVKNAQPDVPYPFTATIDMALGRPFTTASTYVLYANPAGAGAESPAAQD